ncbi:transposase [Methylocella tundrae]|uniref:Transposase n=1 Tax=Methylocella tundrae TaxID=227605 RepID=A0A8B6M9N7_METTU|nr:transposase [Methylocella tundrae]
MEYEYYAGIDVSLKESSLCIVDGTVKVVREVKVPSETERLKIFRFRAGFGRVWAVFIA